MNRKILTASLIYSIPISIVSGIYMVLPSPFNSILWCMYIGFFITNALGPEFSKLPGFIISQIIGWGWALIYNYAVIFLISSMSLPFAMGVGIFIVTVLLCIIHFGFFYGAKWNFVPMLFPPVASFFAVQSDLTMIPYCAASLIIGCVAAIVSMALWKMVFIEKKDKNQVVEE